jgi:hypothetical protein
MDAFVLFLQNDGYSFLRHGSVDDWYQKGLPDGSVNRVRVSRSSGEIGSRQFQDILKKQLKVTQAEFNAKC